MADINFKEGDIVQLKSGGPKMTVDELRKEYKTGRPTALCSWFDGATRKEDEFATTLLKHTGA